MFATLRTVRPARLSVAAHAGDARNAKQPVLEPATHFAIGAVASGPSRFAIARSPRRKNGRTAAKIVGSGSPDSAMSPPATSVKLARRFGFGGGAGAVTIGAVVVAPVVLEVSASAGDDADTRETRNAAPSPPTRQAAIAAT